MHSSQVKSDNVNSIGIYWYWVSLQILLPHSAGNSVKSDRDLLVLSKTSDFASSFCR